MTNKTVELLESIPNGYETAYVEHIKEAIIRNEKQTVNTKEWLYLAENSSRLADLHRAYAYADNNIDHHEASKYHANQAACLAISAASASDKAEKHELIEWHIEQIQEIADYFDALPLAS